MKQAFSASIGQADTSLLKKLRSGPGRLIVALIGLLGGLGLCIQSAGTWQDVKGEPIWLIFLLIFLIAALACSFGEPRSFCPLFNMSATSCLLNKPFTHSLPLMLA